MLRRALDLISWTRRWREQYGQVGGLRLALGLRRALWAAPAGTTVTVHVPTLPHPVRLRAGTSDAKVFVQVLGDQEADFPAFGQPATIVDAGANIGLTAMAFARRFPSATVLAMEIDERNFALLRENCGPYPNIQPVHAGLWSKEAGLRISNPGDEAWSFQTVEAAAGESIVEALGVSDVLRRFALPRIDILKIDVEGSEYEIFGSGVGEWIDRVGVIGVEVHDGIRPGCTDLIREALAGHRFEESTWSEYLVFRRTQTT